ncbi:Baeyer-Villiger monooxygenase [Paraconexibacter sp. AEG42_29]|uniref:Baeyer-Villiger monooxygenase n=1 Tax=Paraconexibacter sp. AEG42_29 TaxID=2997339 RepID=A0AAU7AS14_9ACTN
MPATAVPAPAEQVALHVDQPLPDHVYVAIVGTGAAGIAMAHQLKEAGVDDLVLLEKAADVGGTWRANDYPGCACDVPSHLYSFSFAPNPTWSRAYSSQPEIHAYMQKVAAEQDVLRHVRGNAEVIGAEWDEATQRWTVTTVRGSLTANVVVAGPGPLNDPKIPEIEGLGSFAGQIFHSALWDHDVDLTGKRVAVIGTGASAIQFVPRIQKQVAHLDIYQRTAPWIVPKLNPHYGKRRHALYTRLPLAQRIARTLIYWRQELLVPGFVYDRRFQAIPQKLAETHLKRQVPDPVLREKLRPKYTIGCKRILQANDYYPAVSKPNVDVIDTGIKAVTPEGVVTHDDVVHPCDVIILGTGFHVTDLPITTLIRGKGGVRMSDHFDGSPQCYYGTSVDGFPNLFLLLGPNTGLGHSSVIFMIEAQVAHVMGAVKAMRDRGIAEVEVRADVVKAHNATLQQQMKRTVWTQGGCDSWYLDSKGKNTTLWPGFTWRFRQLAATFNPADYVLTGRR